MGVEAGTRPLTPALDRRSGGGKGGAQAFAGGAVGKCGGVQVHASLKPVASWVARGLGPKAAVDGCVEGHSELSPVRRVVCKLLLRAGKGGANIGLPGPGGVGGPTVVEESGDDGGCRTIYVPPSVPTRLA